MSLVVNFLKYIYKVQNTSQLAYSRLVIFIFINLDMKWPSQREKMSSSELCKWYSPAVMETLREAFSVWLDEGFSCCHPVRKWNNVKENRERKIPELASTDRRIFNVKNNICMIQSILSRNHKDQYYYNLKIFNTLNTLKSYIYYF